MPTKPKLSPGASRTLQVLGEPAAHLCEVMVVDESISLRFERIMDGTVRCTSWQRYESDAPTRASRTAFDQARILALSKMDALQEQERRRALGAAGNVIIDDSSPTECILSYWGAKYSFFCPFDQPLTWDSLTLKGMSYDKEPRPYLEDKEFRDLKARAFNRIKVRREQNDYENEGLGLRSDRQFSLAV